MPDNTMDYMVAVKEMEHMPMKTFVVTHDSCSVDFDSSQWPNAGSTYSLDVQLGVLTLLVASRLC